MKCYNSWDQNYALDLGIGIFKVFFTYLYYEDALGVYGGIYRRGKSRYYGKCIPVIIIIIIIILAH